MKKLLTKLYVLPIITARSQTTDCAYGDEVPSCSISDCSSGTSRRCCSFCSGISVTTSTTMSTESPCQNTASYCELEIMPYPSRCYYTAYKRECCRTCTMISTGISGCEWGDRFLWCAEYISREALPGGDCSNLAADIPFQCCGSCRQPNNNTTTQTSSQTSSSTQMSSTSSTFTTLTTSKASTVATANSMTSTVEYKNVSLSSSTTFSPTSTRSSTVVSQTTLPRTTSPTNSGATITQPSTTIKFSTNYSTTTTSTRASSAATSTVPTTISTIANSPDVSWCAEQVPGICYDSSVRESSCASFCRRHANLSNPNCMYGDKYSWCTSYVSQNALDGNDCSSLAEYIAVECCVSCNSSPQHITTPISNTLASTRQTSSTVTASTTTTTTPFPEPAWCASSYPGICYNPTTAQTCNSFCESHKDESKPDCAYGDYYSWCAPIYCDTVREECCYTCQN